MYVTGLCNLCAQEWWGITDLIKEQALKISEHGYRYANAAVCATLAPLAED